MPNLSNPAPQREDGIEAYFVRQSEWSARTFGHGTRTQGIVEHIRKELEEVLANPHDLEEWVDLIMLSMDGFWRHGGDPREILKHLNAKQAKNFARQWKAPTDGHAVEHVRDKSESSRIPTPAESPCPVTAERLLEIAYRRLDTTVGNELRDLASWLAEREKR